MTQALTERYADRIAGVLSCYDRLVITGTLPTVCYADGMTRYLNAEGIRIFDYPEFAKTLRELVRETAAALASEAGVEIEHVGKPMSARRTSSRACWCNEAAWTGACAIGDGSLRRL